MGATLREVIFDIGGGAEDDQEFKAVQPGGPDRDGGHPARAPLSPRPSSYRRTLSSNSAR